MPCARPGQHAADTATDAAQDVVALAEHLGVNPSTASRMVHRLVTAERMPAATRRELVEALTAFTGADSEPLITTGADALWG